MRNQFQIEAWDKDYEEFEMFISLPFGLGEDYDPFPAAEWLRKTVDAICVTITQIRTHPDGKVEGMFLHEFFEGEWGPSSGELVFLR